MVGMCSMCSIRGCIEGMCNVENYFHNLIFGRI
jgi:hypothetical protein